MKDKYRHVNSLWDEDTAAKLTAVDRLVYRSNLLGADLRITNTGGGNTSSKLMETDPLSGEQTEILWVKGSGGDLRTSKRENFSSLYLDQLNFLQTVYAKKDDKGLKTKAEDDMVGMYTHTAFNLNPRPSSIDTPLHAFLPGKHVDHMHPNAIISIAASKRSKELTQEVFQGKMAYVKWMRPGFELGLAMQEIAEKNPDVKAIMMGQHGFISWADDDKECYYRTLDFIEQASDYIEEKYQANGGDATAFGGEKYQTLPQEQSHEILGRLLPWLRGKMAFPKRLIGTVQQDEKILRFVNSTDAPRLAELGTSCPDHFLRTKIKPLYIAWDPSTGDEETLHELLDAGLEQYRKDYVEYYEKHKHPDSPAMRDPSPRVILVPGIGMIAWGKDKSESRVTAEFYNCAVEVMRGAEAIDSYVALPLQEAFDIEYWHLEEAKLQRRPAEKELARHVVIVIGAGSGIGKETALRLAKESAHIICCDLNAVAAQATADEIVALYGNGIGMAGTGISSCGPAIGLGVNITKRESVQKMLQQVILAYGGFDDICITAGIFVPADTSGHIPDDKWALSFAVNVTGSYLVADEAEKIWLNQNLTGSLVLTSSANATVAKRGSLAYDTSKAAVSHLVRELAIQLSPLIRVNGVAPATVVKGSSMFPRERVIGSLAKYEIDYSEEEETESLVNKLAQFYADRTLTKSPITPADQAEAYYLLVTQHLSKTTGQIIAVDGGLSGAFLR